MGWLPVAGCLREEVPELGGGRLDGLWLPPSAYGASPSVLEPVGKPAPALLHPDMDVSAHSSRNKKRLILKHS